MRALKRASQILEYHMKLPLNCSVDYINDFLSEEESQNLYQTLIDEYHLDQSRLVIEAGGRLIETDSFKILFTTEELLKSNSHPEEVHGKSFAWKGALLTLKEKVEQFTGREYDLAMCLYYPNGGYYAVYHNDQETSGDQTLLPSLSLGAVREFCFKENETQQVYSLSLASGSMLLMGEYCQSRYMHSLPKDESCTTGRINITFREAAFN